MGYGIYSVSELKQDHCHCSVTIPLVPRAAVVPDTSEFITGVPLPRKNRLYCVTP